MSPIQTQIQKDLSENRILIYMKGTPNAPECGFSAAVIDAFNALGCPYETRNVLADEALRQGIKEFSDWPTIPQIYIDGEFIGGCDIAMQMYKSGELRRKVENI